MAVASTVTGIRVSDVHHMRLCSAQAKQLAGFYESALGFREVSLEHLSGARMQECFGVAGRGLRFTLELGAQQITLLQFVDRPGRAYPADSGASDRVFQHFAIVVADMTVAMAKLLQASDWRPITRGGPQQLPAASGGVTAFKFRDPEGHPLEFLAFPPGNTPARWQKPRGHGPFLGIDHSAITVADSGRSVAFYESLGLKLALRTVNDGPTQARLDHLDHPVAEVTAMEPMQATPHVELLCYQGTDTQPPLDLRANDVAATCLVFGPDKSYPRPEASRIPVQDLIDPDGHRLAMMWPDR